MTRLTLEEFSEGMNLLALVYGNDHPVFKNQAIAQIWFDFFSKFTKQRFLNMVNHYLGNGGHWFPKTPADIQKLWEDSGLDRRPGEDWQQFAALPSLEIKLKQELESLTPEQMERNRRRIEEMVKAIARKKTLPSPANF